MKTIDPKTAAELFEQLDYDHGTIEDTGTFGDPVAGWMLLGSSRVGTTRWEERYRLVLREDATGETWGLTYGVGLTENQSDYYPWENRTGPLRLEQVVRRERTVVEYVKAAS